MRRLRNVPIRQKLIFISLLASSVALVLAASALLAFEYFNARQSSLGRLNTIAEVIGANSTGALVFDDAEAATANLSALRAEDRIVSACLYDANRRLLASYTRATRRGDTSRVCATVDVSEAGHRFAQNHSILTLPITMAEERVGSIVIRAETLDITARLVRYVGVGGVILLVCGIVAYLIATRLQRSISLPILELVATSRRVSVERDYAVRAEPGGDDELGLLIESFNEMLGQIQMRDRELERHRDLLDVEVQRRTRALEAAVEELREEITQRERAEAKIRELAYYDVLTGLPSRQLLKERLESAIEDAHRSGQPLALLFLDLDRFKEINDSFGHATGDRLLEQVASRLVGCVRGADHVSRPAAEAGPPATVSRQGGDEFTILLTGLGSHHDASRVCMRILESLQEPFTLGDRDVVIGASLGVAVYPADGADADTLIKHADTAMYHAKSSGGCDFEYFSESMKVAALKRLTLEAELRTGLARGEFFLDYQPVTELESDEVTGVEALIRWRHPTRGVLQPAEFVRVAEESGLIAGIGDWGLAEACRQASAWRELGLPEIRMAVNVSSRQLRKAQLLDSTLAALESSGLPASCLEIEVTESTMIRSEAEAVDTLTRLRELGVRIALDDFGTGFSSLSYLRNLPLDALKIDQSFVRELAEHGQSECIVTAVISMAHGLGLRLVADGVETDIQRELLAARGCDEIQGALVGAPLPPEAIPALLAPKSSGS